jgi:hypothetical protein
LFDPAEPHPAQHIARRSPSLLWGHRSLDDWSITDILDRRHPRKETAMLENNHPIRA